MKSNFSNEDLFAIYNAFASKFLIRVNKAGNIDLVDPNRTNPYEHFVLYARDNGRCLWRRWMDRNYCYPLNMRNRKDLDAYTATRYDNGEEYTWYAYNFARHAEFNSVTEAIEYFKNYIKKYRNR